MVLKQKRTEETNRESEREREREKERDSRLGPLELQMLGFDWRARCVLMSVCDWCNWGVSSLIYGYGLSSFLVTN